MNGKWIAGIAAVLTVGVLYAWFARQSGSAWPFFLPEQENAAVRSVNRTVILKNLDEGEVERVARVVDRDRRVFEDPVSVTGLGGGKIVLGGSKRQVEEVIRLIGEADVPAQRVRLTVRLVAAQKTNQEEPIVDPLVKDVYGKVKGLLPYNFYKSRGLIRMEAAAFDPEPVTASFGEGYAASFQGISVTNGRISIREVKLDRASSPGPILSAPVSAELGKMTIVGISNNTTDQGALILVIEAEKIESE